MYMRLFFLLVFSLPVLAIAQTYHLSYSPDDMPELYNSISIFVDNVVDGTAKPAKGYQLFYKANDEAFFVKKGVIELNKRELYEQNGVLNFIIKKGGKEIPSSLTLPILKDIRFNLYTDSIKPVLDYYLNIEGEFTNGQIYPLDNSLIDVSSSQGEMDGMTWIKPKVIDFDSVTFTAVCRYNPAIAKDITLFIKQWQDPRDKLNDKN